MDGEWQSGRGVLKTSTSHDSGSTIHTSLWEWRFLGLCSVQLVGLYQTALRLLTSHGAPEVPGRVI